MTFSVTLRGIQPRCYAKRGVPLRLIRVYSGEAATTASKTILDRIAAFARSDPFMGNNPPKVTFNGFRVEGYVQEPGTEAEAVLARAQEAATGRRLQSFMTPGYLDARIYANYDKVPSLVTTRSLRTFMASTSA